MASSVVQVVHCIDTEGPLHESLAATFERLRAIFGLDLEPDRATLERLRRQEIDLGGIEAEVAKVISPELSRYNDTWTGLDEMLRDIMAPTYRQRMVDSFGGGWIYNWFCLDHVGFTANPRRRDMGFHNIFDHYAEMIRETGSSGDAIHFHHHPLAPSREAHRCATHFFAHTPMVFEILARDVIERMWFPSCYRPGFHVIRPDSAWFLEQFIPFDFSNQSTDEDYSLQRDLAAGRFGDWRRAPRSWTPYHPDHDDYQTPGQCRRWTARCLNVGTRLRLLQEADVEQAFQQAEAGEPVVLAFTNHDFRDMRPDIERVRGLLAAASARHPGVKWRHAEARDAMRDALDLAQPEPLALDISFADNRMTVTARGRTFGPQPFLALKTRDGRYFHDNLDIQQPFQNWTYVFDADTFTLDALSAIGVAACDAVGNVAVAVHDPVGGTTRTVGR